MQTLGWIGSIAASALQHMETSVNEMMIELGADLGGADAELGSSLRPGVRRVEEFRQV